MDTFCLCFGAAKRPFGNQLRCSYVAKLTPCWFGFAERFCAIPLDFQVGCRDVHGGHGKVEGESLQHISWQFTQIAETFHHKTTNVDFKMVTQ